MRHSPVLLAALLLAGCLRPHPPAAEPPVEVASWPALVANAEGGGVSLVLTADLQASPTYLRDLDSLDIDLAGFTITWPHVEAERSYNSLQASMAPGAALTIRNGTLVDEGAIEGHVLHVYGAAGAAGRFTLDHVRIIGTMQRTLVHSWAWEQQRFTDSTFGPDEPTPGDRLFGHAFYVVGGAVTFERCHFTPWDIGVPIGLSDGSARPNTRHVPLGVCVIRDCVFAGPRRWAISLNYPADYPPDPPIESLLIEGCTFGECVETLRIRRPTQERITWRNNTFAPGSWARLFGNKLDSEYVAMEELCK